MDSPSGMIEIGKGYGFAWSGADHLGMDVVGVLFL